MQGYWKSIKFFLLQLIAERKISFWNIQSQGMLAFWSCLLCSISSFRHRISLPTSWLPRLSSNKAITTGAPAQCYLSSCLLWEDLQCSFGAFLSVSSKVRVKIIPTRWQNLKSLAMNLQSWFGISHLWSF